MRGVPQSAAGRSAAVLLALLLPAGLWFLFSFAGEGAGGGAQRGAALAPRQGGGETVAARAPREAADAPAARAGSEESAPTGPGPAAARAPLAAADGLPRPSLTGTVVDAATLGPVAGAELSVQRGGRTVRGRTDEEGGFALPWDDAAAAIAVAHPRYVDLFVPDAATLEPLTLALERSARIEGRLEPPPADGDDVAVAHAWHQVASSEYSWIRLETPVARDGRFAFDDLAPGEYGVTATAPGRCALVEGNLTLASGQTREVRIVTSPAAKLLGTVLYAPGEVAVAGARLTLEPSGGGKLPAPVQELRTRELETDEAGRFRALDVVPGQYALVVATARGERARFRVSVPSAGAVAERTFELGAPAALEGVVVDARGRPEAGAVVFAFRRADPALAGALDAEADGGEAPRAVCDARGRFRLADVPSGEALCVLARAPRRSGVEPTFATRDVAALDAGALQADLVLSLPVAASLRGRVLGEGGASIAGARVVALRSLAGRTLAVREETTGEDGAFALLGLPPGAYELGLEHEAWLPQRVPLALDGELDLGDVVLAPAFAAGASALDENGAGVGGVLITLTLVPDDAREELSRRGLATRFRETTDAWGRARFAGLCPGEWSLDAHAFGWTVVGRDPELVRVPERDHGALVLAPRERLERFAITGTVRLPQGATPRRLRVDGLVGGVLEVDGGAFRATGLTPTRHRLKLSVPGYAPAVLGPIDPVPGGTQELGVIDLAPATVFEVRVVDARGEPVDGARAALEPLAEDSGGSGNRAGRLRLRGRGQGRYVTTGATHAAWRLVVSVRGEEPVARRVVVGPERRQSVRVTLP